MSKGDVGERRLRTPARPLATEGFRKGSGGECTAALTPRVYISGDGTTF